MKQVVITASFQRRLKALRRHFSEEHVVKDVMRFARSGLGPGECELKKEAFDDVDVRILKLRIRVRSAVGRYLLAVIRDDYIPVFIDLKTGRYGKNMSFNASRKVATMLENALLETLVDYLEHTDETPRLSRHSIA